MKNIKKKILIKSFGCQMNKLDTALVTSALKKAGFSLTDDEKDADAVLINTCSVRQHAEQRVISHLGHLKHIKKSKPDLVVGVIGCMAQRMGAELLEDKTVDIVCGPAQIPQITELVTKALQEKKRTISITEKIRQTSAEDQAMEKFEMVSDGDDSQLPAQAYVRAMRGCNNFCTYCIVPYVRGPEVSRPPEAIIEQIKQLAGSGVKMVTLLGQMINAYRYDSYCLADLLNMASEIDGIEWIRFVTSYPAEEFYEQILKAMAELPKVCHYLHMPAQSGSDKILKAMNRNYTAGKYLELIEKAREIVPGIAISGDFMVGFPGETEDDFEQTVSLVEKTRYKNCFIFKYSPRPGTAAEKRLQDTVPEEVKRQRNIKLLAVQEKISDELAKEYLGTEVKVLVEGPSKKANVNTCEKNGFVQLVGRTADDWIVVFDGPVSLAGEFAKVKITKTSPLTLFGEM
ncbi:MAG: tRNA (N6-isopentenyl adenosine(37)-C2)-methylthiotransferase MiaB [Phycisphaerae bacterium]|nr:tRNA (N6-isopentenyl adenosine(37)-C2)-methylthiotransferase MiaB [Phycisphaerae bacterium]MDD5380963.1 tRNA (N6-isopentenyl adenosine(37)-C2)-methylthiotransferase MiaB [Phycisphaerae bacterium]